MSPYSASQWEAIDQLGQLLDRRLKEVELHFTMGAEPTYIRLEPKCLPEWTVEALGEDKRRLGEDLIVRLQEHFAPGSLLQHGQGKWYPGEPLPRWALRCIWQEGTALSWPDRGQEPGAFSNFCNYLGVNPEHARQLQECETTVLVLGHLPESGWTSAEWPGDLDILPPPGPVGMRLPWSTLPEESQAAGIGTALCLGRDGYFLPPLSSGQAWLELLRALQQWFPEAPLLGYAPPLADLFQSQPGDLSQFSITPDPGVLEVNLPPSSHWNQLRDTLLSLDREARACGLTSQRYWLDGSPRGTGGGCHLVVGGQNPQQSPFALRPDLLRSILTYWNHHPSLSYFFAGMFVGPTSQAPRVDEARHDSLYELELAFAELDQEEARDPKVLGRIFRDLLVDVSGNGHRSEICVDKLFDPLAPGGRQGLLEFRALEMPPHPHMNLAMMLLFRSLLCYLWRHPRREPLVRHGNQLHDRFMLPSLLWQDLVEVLADLNEFGLGLEPQWYRPQFDFRFPLLGRCRCQGVCLELRTALEPWPVLGEGSGSSRPVDSSLQRIEARVEGLQPDHTLRVACNGTFLPLQAVGPMHLGAVRFRAWHFANSLHPTVGIQTPLRFDLVDIASGRSLGGCRYHTTSPDGVHWEHPPEGPEEAEQRRRCRFEEGLPPLPTNQWREPAADDEFPFTLDLRRVALQLDGG